MFVEKLAQYDDNKGLFALEAIRKADENNKTILSSKELSDRLVNTDEWKNEKEVYPVWSGTLFAHMKPDEPFPSILEKNNFKLKVPKKWQGMKNKVILCNHPDFKTEADGTITLGASAKIFDNMPKENGWYDADNEFEYPLGEKKDYVPSRRYLWRRSGSFVGLVSRCYYLFGGRRVVDCDDYDYFRHGVLVKSRAKRDKRNEEKDKKLYLEGLEVENSNLKEKLNKIKRILEE